MIVDCPRCQGPMPWDAHCPHCGSGAGRSLRTLVATLALIGASACGSAGAGTHGSGSGSSSGISVLYGIAIIDAGPCTDLSAGDECRCGASALDSGAGLCVCTGEGQSGGVCVPYGPDGG